MNPTKECQSLMCRNQHRPVVIAFRYEAGHVGYFCGSHILSLRELERNGFGIMLGVNPQGEHTYHG